MITLSIVDSKEVVIDYRALAIALVLFALIPLIPLSFTTNVSESIDNATRIKGVFNYTIITNCIDDPFTNGVGFRLHLFASLWFYGVGSNVRNFNYISSGIIQSRAYNLYSAGITTIIGSNSYTWRHVEQVLLFYFTTTTTTSITISSLAYNVDVPSFVIPSMTYQAYNVYRYRLYFPVTQYTTSDYVLYYMPGLPRQDTDGVSVSISFFDSNGNSVSITVTRSQADTTPSSGSYTYTMTYMFSFNNSADVGKSFKYLVVTSTHSSYGTLPHLIVIFDTPFTIQAVGDTIVFTFIHTLSSNI